MLNTLKNFIFATIGDTKFAYNTFTYISLISANLDMKLNTKKKQALSILKKAYCF